MDPALPSKMVKKGDSRTGTKTPCAIGDPPTDAAGYATNVPISKMQISGAIHRLLTRQGDKNWAASRVAQANACFLGTCRERGNEGGSGENA